MNKVPQSTGRIWGMNVGMLGINIGWGLQMALMSAIYEYLHADPSSIPILWLAAPLTGLLVQPIIGYYSDNTWGKYGRRKPYIFAGAVLSMLALFLMPISSCILMAAVLLWVLDASVNVSMGPFRALIPDVLPESQYTKGYLIQSILIVAGCTIASALPLILQHVFGLSLSASSGEIPTVIKLSFWIGGIVFMGSILWSLLSTKEYPPEKSEVKKESKKDALAVFKHIYRDFIEMPAKMKTLAWVTIFTWMGLFCMYMFFSIAIARHIFGAADTSSPQYMEGIAWAALCFAVYAACSFVTSTFIFPALLKVISRKVVHALALTAGGLGLIATLVIQSKWMLFLSMAGIGVCYASTQCMPYAMAADVIPPKKMGVYMAFFNLFIVIPEVIISLGFGFVLKNFLHDDRLLAVVAGGFFMLIAAVITLTVKDEQ